MLKPKSKVQLYFHLSCFLLLSILFVFIRMKGVEQDYAFNELNKELKRSKILNKELKVEKANVLNVKRLRQLAKNFRLEYPTEKQIIVIP
jgi:hypothetical protein